MKSYISALICMFGLLLFATACNNDVFIDAPDISEDLSATIEGDGGSAEFAITTKNLEYISLDVFSENRKFCTYYNTSGEIIDRDSPASEVYKIVFDNDFTKIEIIKKGKKLFFTSISNTWAKCDWTIRLDYGYTVKFINVTVLQGKPMELLDIVYGDIETSEYTKIGVDRILMENGSTMDLTTEVYPYIQTSAEILVKPTDPNSWIRAERFDMPVPVYDGNGWKMEVKNILPGTSYRYHRPDQMMEVTIEVPAKSVVRVRTDIDYAKVEARGTMFFLNPVLDRQLTAYIICTSSYPIHYDLHIDEEPLK